jgi:DNA-binding SARP family transcriptional activator/Tfp pilus assembly protein PilF
VPARVAIGVLGPFEVWCDGVAIAVGAGKQRAVLAALLLQIGRTVPAGELAELLWAPPPPSANVTVRNYIRRLRRVLGPAGGQLILTGPGGYLVKAEHCELDVAQMERELSAARRAGRDGDWEQAGVRAAASLGLWRGEPLSDVDLPALTVLHIPRLAEMRLQAHELRIEADLALGRHAEVVTELPQLLAVHPVRERLYAQLMVAYYRSGRRAEALATYRSAYDVLAAEAGAEPGPELQALHRKVLHDDPALAGSPASGIAAGLSELPAHVPAVTGGGAEVVPRQLPAAVAFFTGRDRELAALTSLLGPEPGVWVPELVISAIGGSGGVGKTALAVQWAHRVADRFPDGQLYVNLCGYDPDQPVPAADALAGFLRALGMAGERIPAETEERAAAYRSLLAGRRILVVLDNARTEEQVRPLLPGGSSCAVVVTSRDTLAGLVARDGAVRLEVDLLPPQQAEALLRGLIGARADADPDAAAALAACCCRLPLALRLAAELANARPGVSLATLVGELADVQERLDLLDAGGDVRTAIRAVFSWSCRYLDDDAARAFRMAGLHPGSDFDAYAVAALTGATVPGASRQLAQLARAHLIQPAGLGRYCMHDLLRGYARELAAEHDRDDQRRAVLTDVFDYYLYTAASAMNVLLPAERNRRPAIPPPTVAVPQVSDAPAARAWLDAERANLVAAATQAATHGWPGHATLLSATLYRYLDLGGYYVEASTIHGCARRAARDTGDRAAEAATLNCLGVTDWRQGRFLHATSCFRDSLALYREAGDRAGQGRVLVSLALVELAQGRYRQAASHHRQSLALFRETGDRIGEARALVNLGDVELRLGRYRQAASHHRQSLALFRETGDRIGEASTLDSLGNVELRQGRYPQATSHVEEALALARETGDRTSEAAALDSLGTIELRQGRYPQATSHLGQALALVRETGYRTGESGVLNSLGELSLATGEPARGRIQYAAALDLASQTGDKYQQARAHHGLGTTCHHLGDPGQAHHHWQQALTVYTDLGTPEADAVRILLTPRDRADA